MANFSKVTAIIPAGANISHDIEIPDGATSVGIIMPAGWTTAAATFQASDQPQDAGGVFKNVYNAAGTELTLASNAANRAYQTVSGLECFKHLKIRSGSAATPVTQVGRQEIIFVCKG